MSDLNKNQISRTYLAPAFFFCRIYACERACMRLMFAMYVLMRSVYTFHFERMRWSIGIWNKRLGTEMEKVKIYT